MGQTLAAMQVEVQDAQGNRVTGASNLVTITAPGAAGLAGDDDENASAGVATFNALRLTRAGTFQLTARSSGLANDVSSAVTIAKGGTSVAIVSRSPTTSVVGQQVTISYQVSVSDPAEGTPTGTVTVSDGTQSCNGGVSGGSGTGSCADLVPDRGDAHPDRDLFGRRELQRKYERRTGSHGEQGECDRQHHRRRS